MIKLEALNAKHGDALLLHFEAGGQKRLWMIDGGPGGVWKGVLRDRLEALKGKKDTLTIDLAMLSHVDEDHVTGMLQMAKSLAEKKRGAPTFLDIRKFWHNSFADLVGEEASLKKGLASLAGAQAAAGTAMASKSPNIQVGGVQLSRREVAVLASIGQGRELRDYLEQLKLSGNEPYNATIASGLKKRKVDGAQVTVIGPIESRLKKFRQNWAAAASNPAALASLFDNKLDESPTNLSSLVLLVEIDGRKILLTGDARADDIVEGFVNAGIRLPIKLDILKVQHHGSKRNMRDDFLKKFPADNYVISADGKYDNPDAETVASIVEVRGNDKYTIHFTNKLPRLVKQADKLSKGKKFKCVFRDKSQPSLTVTLS